MPNGNNPYAPGGTHWKLQCPLSLPLTPFPKGETLTHGEPSNPSCASVPNSDLLSLHDHRDLAHAARVFEHLLKLVALSLDVYVFRILTVGRPGLVCIGSPSLAKNNHLLCHNKILLQWKIETQ